MNLQEFIDTIEHFPKTMPVVFSGGNIWPSSFASWRGNYHELTLVRSNDQKPLTVSSWQHKAQDAMYGKFYGYKGGWFKMGPTTTVWADNYGECNGNKLIGVKVVKGQLNLIVANSKSIEKNLDETYS